MRIAEVAAFVVTSAETFNTSKSFFGVILFGSMHLAPDGISVIIQRAGSQRVVEFVCGRSGDR
jgi:hypothetical protein